MVVVTAVLSAGLVAVVSDVVVPDDLYADSVPADWFGSSEISDRVDYGGSVAVDPNAPEVWLLPLRPEDGWVIGEKGRDRGNRNHYGWDLQPRGGRSIPIYSVHAGVVVDIAYEPEGFGRNVKIHHGDGIVIIYAHQCCFDGSNIVVSEGQQVQAGTRIGTVGTTGRSTGPHLHFEIRRYNIGGAGQILWNSGYTPILAVGDFLRERGVDIETQQETANGGMVG